MDEKVTDKCLVCGNDSFWYGKIDRVTRYCACRKCGVMKITPKCLKETEDKFNKALESLEKDNV